MAGRKKKQAADQHKSKHMVRLSPEQHAQLKALAGRNDRKMTVELSRALREHFKREGMGQPPDTST